LNSREDEIQDTGTVEIEHKHGIATKFNR